MTQLSSQKKKKKKDLVQVKLGVYFHHKSNIFKCFIYDF